MRFCPQCGAPLIAGAKFCVDCGRPLASGAASGAGEAGGAGPRVDALRRNMPITTAFVFVFVAITVIGLLAAAWIMLRTPEAVRDQVASAPITSAPNAGGSPAQDVASSGGAEQNGGPNPAAGGSQSGDLPTGHPKIELPTEARTFIDKIEKEAQSKPSDVMAWDKLGAVSMRAAMFDQSYYGRAEEAYGHVLKLEPDNLDALRGIGDIDYDKQHYDEAIAAYEHYLKKKPDDPEVRTDLGTMYLYTGNPDQAVVQYKKAVGSKPGFFQAYYNMGIAYAQENKPAEAAITLKQAMTLAPDDTARKQVKDLIAKLSGGPITVAGASTQRPSAAASPAAQARNAAASPAAQVSKNAAASPVAKNAASSPADKNAAPSPAAKSTQARAASSVAVSSADESAKSPASSAADSPATAPSAGASPSMKDFHGSIEQMVRGLPIAGPRVSSVQWPDRLKGRVLMDNFPMDQMPPFAKTKFLDDLKAGIDSAKSDSKIISPVELDIVDSASGRVMETITH
jgi:cytochrome c-type biogenesis protein CcmH/NrfG